MQTAQTTPPPTNLSPNPDPSNLNPNSNPWPSKNTADRKSRTNQNLATARYVILRCESIQRQCQLRNELIIYINGASLRAQQAVDRSYAEKRHQRQKKNKKKKKSQRARAPTARGSGQDLLHVRAIRRLEGEESQRLPPAEHLAKSSTQATHHGAA